MAVVGSRLSSFVEKFRTPKEVLQALRGEGLLLEEATDERVTDLVKDEIERVEAAVSKQGFTFNAVSTSIAAALLYGGVLSPKGNEWGVSYCEIARLNKEQRDDYVALISLLISAAEILITSRASSPSAFHLIGVFGAVLSFVGAGYLLLRTTTLRHIGFGLIVGICSIFATIQILYRMVQ